MLDYIVFEAGCLSALFATNPYTKYQAQITVVGQLPDAVLFKIHQTNY